MSRTKGRLNLDCDPADQPDGSYRFALNAVESGDENLSNEQSNVNSIIFPKGHVLLGHVYVGDNQTCVFSVDPITHASSIGVIDAKGYYHTQIDDGAKTIEEASGRLNFSLEHQIYGIYRLRNGSERNVYWVDGLNKPRCINLDRKSQHKLLNGEWNYKSFDLFVSSKKLPRFTDVHVENQGGNLKPGSYNVAIQYLDAGLNATEWLCVTQPVLVYNDSMTSSYSSIAGSCIDPKFPQLSYPHTNKAVSVTLDKLDETFPYYQLALIEYSSGTGQPTRVGVTAPISTMTHSYILTGDNAVKEVPIEEVSAVYDSIETARHIEQLQGRLLLGHVTKSRVDWCILQEYASKITTDCVVRPAVHGNIRSHRAGKSPQVLVDGASYMPGEVYSFGIVYVLDDGTVSPVFHIPGKAKAEPQKKVYGKRQHKRDMLFGMGHHEMADGTTYTDRAACRGQSDYWKYDAQGRKLTGEPVRHHRFPSRKEIGLPHFRKNAEESPNDLIAGTYIATVYLKFHKSCSVEQIKQGVCTPARPVPFPFRVKVVVVITDFDGRHLTELNEEIWEIDTDRYENDPHYRPGDEVFISRPFSYTMHPYARNAGKRAWFRVQVGLPGLPDEWFDLDTERAKQIGLDTVVRRFEPWDYGKNPGPKAECSPCVRSAASEHRFTTYPLSVQFSDITLPTPKQLGGHRIVGYQIVRQERTDADMEVLDTGVALPLIYSKAYERYTSSGLIVPAVEPLKNQSDVNYPRTDRNDRAQWYSDKIALRVLNCGYNLVFPTNLFFEDKQPQFTHMVEEGYFNIDKACYSAFGQPDVMDGSSYQKGVNDDYEKDNDGWRLFVQCREHRLSFKADTFPAEGGCYIYKAGIDKVFYLKALQAANWEDGGHLLYNAACDNRACIVTTKRSIRLRPDRHIPYMAICRENKGAYADWQTRPYYALGNAYIPFERMDDGTYGPSGNTTHVELGGGDVFISPMRFVQSTFVDNLIPKRSTKNKSKTSIWKIVLGAFVALVGVVLAAFTGGTSLAAALAIAGPLIAAGAMLAKSGLEMRAMIQAYKDDWATGLRMVARDGIIHHHMIGPDLWYHADGSVNYGGGNGHVGPDDDTIMWCVMSLNDLYFESPVNIALRHQLRGASSYFLQPGASDFENYKNWINNPYDHYKQPATGSLQELALRKLTIPDDKREQGKAYIGVALGEYYGFNLDYNRIAKERKYFMLPLSYLCCGDNREVFERRIQYSDVSDQEELSDGYRKFRANNYVDIEGDTGKLRNLFVFDNNLFVHTDFGLYRMPENVQERVNSDGLVSYLGTGDFFSLKPQKIVDDTMHSAGLQDKLSVVKTPYGVYFVSGHERAIYHFDGKGLEKISEHGLRGWFWDKLHDKWLIEYPYQYQDNLTHPFGVGYVSVFDEEHNRVLFTKHGLTDRLRWPEMHIRDKRVDEKQEDYDVKVRGRALDGRFSYMMDGQLYAFLGLNYYQDELEHAVEQDYQAELRAYVKRHYPSDPFEKHEAEAKRNVPRKPSWEFRGVREHAGEPALQFTRTVTKRELRKEKRVRVVNRAPLEKTHVVCNVDMTGWAEPHIRTFEQAYGRWMSRHKELDANLVVNPRPALPHSKYLNLYELLHQTGVLIKVPPIDDPLEELKGKRVLVFWITSMHFPRAGYVESCDAKDFVTNGHYDDPKVDELVKQFINVSNACDKFQMLVVTQKCFAEYWYGQMLMRPPAFSEELFYEQHRNAPDWMKAHDEDQWRNLKTQMIHLLAPTKAYKAALSCGGLSRYGLIVVSNGSDEHPSFTSEEFLDTWLHSWKPYTEEEVYEEEYWHEWEDEELYHVPGTRMGSDASRYAWTISYSLATKSWVSWHSYTPYCYIRHGNSFISANRIKPDKMYSHAMWGNGSAAYQKFYDMGYPMIVEVIGRVEGDSIRTWEDFSWRTVSVQHVGNGVNPEMRPDTTFTQVMFYNDLQNTGWMNLTPNVEDEDFMLRSVQHNDASQTLLVRKEHAWHVNHIRDANNQGPNSRMFLTGIEQVMKPYGHWIDKVLDNRINASDREWHESDPLRDSYICCRLVFDGAESTMTNLTLRLHDFGVINSER